MDKPTDWVQMAIDHQKTCQECSDRHVCDEMADINLKVLELALFGKIGQ